MGYITHALQGPSKSKAVATSPCWPYWGLLDWEPGLLLVTRGLSLLRQGSLPLYIWGKCLWGSALFVASQPYWNIVLWLWLKKFNNFSPSPRQGFSLWLHLPGQAILVHLRLIQPLVFPFAPVSSLVVAPQPSTIGRPDPGPAGDPDPSWRAGAGSSEFDRPKLGAKLGHRRRVCVFFFLGGWFLLFLAGGLRLLLVSCCLAFGGIFCRLLLGFGFRCEWEPL